MLKILVKELTLITIKTGEKFTFVKYKKHKSKNLVNLLLNLIKSIELIRKITLMILRLHMLVVILKLHLLTVTQKRRYWIEIGKFLYKKISKKRPEQIVIKENTSIIQFLNELSSNDKFKFKAKLTGNYIRISSEIFSWQIVIYGIF